MRCSLCTRASPKLMCVQCTASSFPTPLPDHCFNCFSAQVIFFSCAIVAPHQELIFVCADTHHHHHPKLPIPFRSTPSPSWLMLCQTKISLTVIPMYIVLGKLLNMHSLHFVSPPKICVRRLSPKAQWEN